MNNIQEAIKNLNGQAREVWLAGLGAFARVQEEGQKTFEKLVKEGEKFEKKTRKVADETISDVRGNVESRFSTVKKTATDNWDKLEKVFEQRVSKVLTGLGVPSREDINELAAQIEKLSKEVNKLSGPSATKKTTSKTSASKSATAKAKATKAA